MRQELDVGVLTFVDSYGGRECGGRVRASYDADLEGVRSFQQVGEDDAAYLAACLSLLISIGGIGMGRAPSVLRRLYRCCGRG